MKSETHLALFAKFWCPGKVKTRLASKLGNEMACRVYFKLLSHLLNALGHVADRRSIVFQPLEKRPEFSRLGNQRWELVPQTTGDLGDKLSHCFSQLLTSRQSDPTGLNTRKVVVIGSDCPLVNSKRIAQAFGILDQCPVVLGPSSDGGYYLVGMREDHREIFQGISWSTSSVLAETISRLNARSIKFDLLPEMADIDEAEDLANLMNQLAISTSPAERELLRRLRDLGIETEVNLPQANDSSGFHK